MEPLDRQGESDASRQRRAPPSAAGDGFESYQRGDRRVVSLGVDRECPPDAGADNAGVPGRSPPLGGKRPLFLLALASLAAAAAFASARRPRAPDEYAALLGEYYVDDPSPPSLPLLGGSKSRRGRHHGHIASAQDLARRYREAFLDRGLLLKTESAAAHGPPAGGSGGVMGGISAPPGCEGTVLLIRHCEKSDVREHCAYVGYERSVYLATLFGDGDERWPVPSYVYALNPGERGDRKKRNEREVETVRPLADKANLTVDYSFGLKEVPKLSKHIFQLLRSGEMCGKLTVISWKHEDLPRLAHHLGCGPFEGCPLDYPGITFDEAWQIKYVYMVPWNSIRKNGKLDKRSSWRVFGNIQQEGFDPLAFSKRMGDYPHNGTDTGGRWMRGDEREKDREEEEEAVSRGRSK